MELDAPRSGRNSVKNSWIHIVIRLSIIVEWFIISEASRPSKILAPKNFIKKIVHTRSISSRVISRIVQLPLSLSASVARVWRYRNVIITLLLCINYWIQF